MARTKLHRTLRLWCCKVSRSLDQQKRDQKGTGKVMATQVKVNLPDVFITYDEPTTLEDADTLANRLYEKVYDYLKDQVNDMTDKGTWPMGVIDIDIIP
jgi:hypothetical protein